MREGEAKPDPRASPPGPAEIPRFVAAGAALYNEGKYWHAHEEWELAWHGLRAAGRQDEADFLQGLVFVTACLENLRRGKPDGFRRQLAKALRRLQGLPGAGQGLGLADEAGFVAALERLARAAEGREVLGLRDLPEPPPPLRTR